MRCEDLRDQLLDMTTVDLITADPRLRAHLETCENCRREVERLSRTWQLLTAIPEVEPDSDAMRARFAAALPRRTRAFGWAVPVSAAAALILAVSIGVIVGRQLPSGQTDEVGAIRQELRDVREMLALSLLQQSIASERIRGVSAAARMENVREDVAAAILDTLMHDPDVNVRLACVRALERINERPAVRSRVVEALVREQSPLVTMALIDFVVEAMDDMAVDTLRRLSQDAERDGAVRESAAAGVERLLGRGRL